MHYTATLRFYIPVQESIKLGITFSSRYFIASIRVPCYFFILANRIYLSFIQTQMYALNGDRFWVAASPGSDFSYTMLEFCLCITLCSRFAMHNLINITASRRRLQ